MKPTLLTILAAVTFTAASAQTSKDTFYLQSFPTYDEYGNYYQIVKAYDHIPTSKDTAEFKRESSASISKMMDSVVTSYKIVPKRKSVKRI